MSLMRPMVRIAVIPHHALRGAGEQSDTRFCQENGKSKPKHNILSC